MSNKYQEALENLVHCKSETKCKECKHKYRCTMERDYHTIKQDLERLEQLEKENQSLKDKINYENDKNICEKIYLRGVINDLQQTNEKLKKENQELKDKNTKMFVELSNTITAINQLQKDLEVLREYE